MSEREDILSALVELAGDAAAIVSEVYQTEFSVDFKSGDDPVTAADRRANDLICAQLAAAFPGVPIVAEESDPKTFTEFRAHERVFFVDPLDGTREFVKKNGEFAVMIGMLDGERPSIGVIHAPALGVCWSGIVDVGAWLTTADGARTPLAVSTISELAQARVVASRSHRSKTLEEALAFLGVRRMDPLGSAGLKCGEVASGRAEAYLAPGRAGHRWDICAGDAIVVAAGGRVSDGTGAPIDYRAASLENQAGLVVSNGALHEAILERVRSIRTPPG